MKKLYKSDHDQIIDGIIAGVGEYYTIDPTILRLAFIIIVLFTGVFPGIFAYIIALFVVPERPHTLSSTTPPASTPSSATIEDKMKEMID